MSLAYRHPFDEQWFIPPNGEWGNRASWREYPPHAGVDYNIVGGSSGTTIRAIANGTIRGKSWSSTYGNRVWIEHDDGMWSHYAHMRNPSLRNNGDRVAAGNPIGYIGDTGSASKGPHLHLELARSQWACNDGNQSIDPIAFINNNPGTTDPGTTPPPQHWKESTMRLIGSTDGRVWLVGPGGSVHVTTEDHVRLLQRVLNSDPTAYDTFTPGQATLIDRYMKGIAGPQTNGVTLLKTTDGKAFLGGPGGVVHILNPGDLTLLDRYLKSSTRDVDTFTVREKDIIGGYLEKLSGK